MPHPAEDQMFLRIQTAEGVSAQDALRKGLKDLKEMCKVTKNKFEDAMVKFNDENWQFANNMSSIKTPDISHLTIQGNFWLISKYDEYN